MHQHFVALLFCVTQVLYRKLLSVAILLSSLVSIYFLQTVYSMRYNNIWKLRKCPLRLHINLLGGFLLVKD